MPRTKGRKVERSAVEMNLTGVNATMGNQSKTIKDILYEFDYESNIHNACHVEHEYLIYVFVNMCLLFSFFRTKY
jgi:hypothetical protein